MDLSLQIACAFATVSTFLAVMLTLMICLPYCLSKHSRMNAKEVNFAISSMSTINFNPENEDDANSIGDGLLYENEYGFNPVVLDEDDGRVLH